MAKRCLILSRGTKMFPHWAKTLERLGYGEFRFTGRDKESLNSVIEEYKPDLLIVGSGFYQSCTPYMVGRLLDVFPWLNVAAVNIHEYPDDLAMFFIINGARSYVNMMDGMEEFERGLVAIRDGGSYVAKGVTERLALRKELPKKGRAITDRQREVMRLICSGFRDAEIAETLHISRSTVENHKTEIYAAQNARNPCELMVICIRTGEISIDEVNFYPKNYMLNSQPEKKAG